MAQFLGRKGWRAEIVKSGASVDRADVTISGHVLALSVDAKSRVGSTALTTASRIVIHAHNHRDGSVIRMALNGTGSDSIFWFEPEDVQQLVNDVLNDYCKQLIQNTRVEGKVLRLRKHAA